MSNKTGLVPEELPTEESELELVDEIPALEACETEEQVGEARAVPEQEKLPFGERPFTLRELKAAHLNGLSRLLKVCSVKAKLPL